MDALIQRHSEFWKDPVLQFHLAISVAMLIVSLAISYVALNHTTVYTGNIVPDILLDNLPVIDVSYVFFQGAFGFLIGLCLFLFWRPNTIPFVLESTALFYFTRSIFTLMTHMSAPHMVYYKYASDGDYMSHFTFTVSSGNDMFFSGHAGFPFLLALIFWKNKNARYIFLLVSLIASIAVIVGHLHYTIDVFSAYFITYGIFEASKHFFKRAYAFMPEHLSA